MEVNIEIIMGNLRRRKKRLNIHKAKLFKNTVTRKSKKMKFEKQTMSDFFF